MTDKLDVVVWDGRPGTSNVTRCLRSLQNEDDGIGDVVVVERGRGEPVSSAIAYPVVARRKTPGAGRNAGARSIPGRNLAFIGADIEVQAGWASAMKAALSDGAGVAAGSARSTRPRSRDADWELGDPFGRNGFLTWGSALNMAVRREVFEDLGGFEEGLPALDDADLCFRSHLAGHAVATAPEARAMVTSPPRRSEFGYAVQLGRAEALLGWRYRENPYFAVQAQARDWHHPLSRVGAAAAWAQLFARQRPVPDLIFGHETHRYVVMPLVAGPAAIVKMRDGQNVVALVAELRARHDLASCLPGPDSFALAHWDDEPGWALASTRAAHAAGWRFEPRLAARRLEQEHPKSAGAAFIQMGAVLAWYQAARGFALLSSGENALRLAERLPEAPLIDLAGGDDLTGISDESCFGEVRPRLASRIVVAASRPRRRNATEVATASITRGSCGRAIDDVTLRMTRDPRLMVSGCPRSGTTLFRNMLAAHPDLAVPLGEGNFVIRIFGQMKLAHRPTDLVWAWERMKVDRHFQAWDLDTELLDAVIAEHPPASYADLVRIIFAGVAARQNKPFSADKCTSYSMHWQWLAEQFPTTRFVHVVRDPRETCMSLPLQYFHHGGVAGAAWWWLIHVMGAPKVAAALGERWLEIRYEDLVADPVNQLDAVCRHAGIEFDDAMLRYTEATSKPAGVLHHAAADAPRQEIRKWREAFSHDDLVTIERITGPLMTRYGYEPETKGISLGAASMTARFFLREARNQWLLSGAPGPGTLENLLALRWRAEL